MNINRYVSGDDKKPFHSSGYANAANKDNLGAASYETFSQRMHIENSRQTIRKYRDSMIAREHARLNRHRTSSGNEQPLAPNSRQAMNAGEQNMSQTPDTPKPASNRQAFREPPGRGYNPYG